MRKSAPRMRIGSQRSGLWVVMVMVLVKGVSRPRGTPGGVPGVHRMRQFDAGGQKYPGGQSEAVELFRNVPGEQPPD